MGFCYTLQPKQTLRVFHRWTVHPELSWHLTHFLHINCLCLYDLLNPGSLSPSLWMESHADLKTQAEACTAEWNSSPWKPPRVLRPGHLGQTTCRFLIPVSELPRANTVMAVPSLLPALLWKNPAQDARSRPPFLMTRTRHWICRWYNFLTYISGTLTTVFSEEN